MKYCPNCGAQLPDNAMFCSACGTQFGMPQQPYQQPYQQQPQKMTYWDKVKAAQKKQKIKWWVWPIIAAGTYLLLQLFPIS